MINPLIMTTEQVKKQLQITDSTYDTGSYVVIDNDGRGDYIGQFNFYPYIK